MTSKHEACLPQKRKRFIDNQQVTERRQETERGGREERERERSVSLTIKKRLKLGEYNALSGNTERGVY